MVTPPWTNSAQEQYNYTLDNLYNIVSRTVLRVSASKVKQEGENTTRKEELQNWTHFIRLGDMLRS